MSNRKRPRRGEPQHPVSAMISALDGARVEGGCEHCDAYQTIQANAAAGLHIIHVWHDDWCPEHGAVGGGRPEAP